MRITLKIWRQRNPDMEGHFDTIHVPEVSPHMSFLEMLDVVSERLVDDNRDPIAFDHDCREGICGMCSLVINGVPHGPDRGTTACQLHMRRFRDGDTVTVEPFRARAFPVIKDLVVDRSAFDRIIQSGGHVSVSTGGTPDANEVPIPKREADVAMDAAACIGCGACVATCKNASAMLFVAAKAAHLGHLPQGQPERLDRAREMVIQMDAEGFGACTNTLDCEAACPKEISTEFIGELNRDFRRAMLAGR